MVGLAHAASRRCSASLDLREIEVVDDGYGRPALALHGTVAQRSAACSTSLSLSHDGDAAIAVVLFGSVRHVVALVIGRVDPDAHHPA